MTDTNADAQKSPPPLLEFEKISVVRDGRRLLDSVSLTVQEGEHIAILGPNGAGKSSLVRTITREYYPSSPGPDVIFRFRGQDRWDAFDLRSHLASSPAISAHLHPRISGRRLYSRDSSQASGSSTMR